MWLKNLTADDLRPPPQYSKTHTYELKGKATEVVCSERIAKVSSSEPLIMEILGIYLRDCPGSVPAVVKRFALAIQRDTFAGSPREFVGGGLNGAVLTGAEKAQLDFFFRYTAHPKVEVRGVLFTTTDSDGTRRTCNSGVMWGERVDDNASEVRYGTIRRIVSHVLAPGLAPIVLVSVNLFERTREICDGRLSVVRPDEDGQLRVELIEKLYCQNVVYWPLVFLDGFVDGGELVAIYRRTHNRKGDR